MDDLFLAVGQAMGVELPAGSGGSGSYSYSLAGAPSWVSRSGRTITGTAPYRSETSTLNWTVRDTNTNRTDTISFRIVVTLAPLAMPAIASRALAGGDPLSLNLPVASGGSGTFTYAMTGRPTWMSRAGNALTGTAPYADSTHTLTWTATDSRTGQTVARQFTVSVAFSSLAMATISDRSLLAGERLAITLPTASGGSGSFDYALTGAPSWMSRASRTLSGTAPVESETHTLTWTATDRESSQTVARSFDVTVAYQPLVMPPIADLSTGSGRAVSITLPAATGGSGSFTYTLTGRPSWLALNDRVLSGTAPATASSTSLTWEAEDDDTGSTISRQFDVTVSVNQLATPRPGVSYARATEIRLFWPSVANATGYEIRHKTRSATTWEPWRSTIQLNRTYSGLQINTTYDFELRATANGYATSAAAAVSATTTATVLTTPAVSVQGISQTELSASWGAIANADRYEYRYAEGSSAPTGSWTSAGTATSVTIRSLTRNTEYTVQVRAVGSGSYATSIPGSGTAMTLNTRLIISSYGRPAGESTTTRLWEVALGPPISVTELGNVSLHSASSSQDDNVNGMTAGGGRLYMAHALGGNEGRMSYVTLDDLDSPVRIGAGYDIFLDSDLRLENTPIPTAAAFHSGRLYTFFYYSFSSGDSARLGLGYFEERGSSWVIGSGRTYIVNGRTNWTTRLVRAMTSHGGVLYAARRAGLGVVNTSSGRVTASGAWPSSWTDRIPQSLVSLDDSRLAVVVANTGTDPASAELWEVDVSDPSASTQIGTLPWDTLRGLRTTPTPISAALLTA